MRLLCICDEEECYCMNLVDTDIETIPPPDVACQECAAGHHLMDPGGPRT